MRKRWGIVLVICMVFVLLPRTAFATETTEPACTCETAEGDGSVTAHAEGCPLYVEPVIHTRSTVTEIGTLAEFNTFAQAVAGGDTYTGKTVRLTENITLASNWSPVGGNGGSGGFSGCKAFAGTFDGNGKTITLPSKTVNGAAYNYIALFARNTGTIENLTVAGGTLLSVLNGAYDVYMAGVAAYNSGTVRNCVSSVTVNGNGNNSNRYFAGIVAHNDTGGTVEDCSFNGSTTTGGRYKAGIVARNYGTVKHCWSTTSSFRKGYDKGGIVAVNESSGIVTECYCTGNNNEGSNNGGIAHENKGTISYCFYDGSISGANEQPATLVSKNSDTLTSCYSPTGSSPSDDSQGYYRLLVRTNTGIFTNCYYDSLTNHAPIRPGTGRPTTQMTQTTALDTGNMDALGGNTMWTVKANTENATNATLYYPQLKYFADKGHNHLQATGYRLSFDANGGTGSVASVLQRAGEAITVPGGTGLTPPTGLYFNNWNTVADGSGTPYEAGSSFTASVHSTLYAQYTTDHKHPVCGAACSHTPAHETITYQPLTSASSFSFNTSGNYYLAEDITLSWTFHVSTSDPTAPTAVNLCLNGHKLSRSTAGRVVEVGSGATLNICDCNGSHGSHEILNPATADDTTDTVTITGGVITGSTNSGVVLFGTLNLYGGTIAGNTQANNGGGVIMSTGKFNMYGGSITANRAGYHGGGVSVYTGFTMYGGTINGNSAAGNGGGVHSNGDNNTTNIYGGTISADGAEYAVYLQNGKLVLSGAPAISSGNTANADIYLGTSNSASLIIAGVLTNATPYRVYKDGGTAGTIIATATTAAHADASKFASANTNYSLAANATESGSYPKSVYLVANTYTVTHTLTNLTATSGTAGAGKATYNTAYTTTLTPAANYSLPTSIIVKVGGTALTSGYTYSNGVVSIAAASVTGDIEIIAYGVANTYAVTVTSGTGGGNFAAGATVTITADIPQAGQRFKEWTMTPSVTFIDNTSATSAVAKFTMPAQAVTAEATFAMIPAPPPDPGYSTGRSTRYSAGNEYPGAWAGSALTVQADCAKLASVIVDNAILTRERDYIAQCGSTVITLTPAYLATLPNGTHTIQVQFTDGRYEGTFTTPLAGAVAAPAVAVPDTGSPAWAAAFVFLCGACCLLARKEVCKRRRG